MITKKARLCVRLEVSKPDLGWADIRSGKKSRQEKFERKNGVADNFSLRVPGGPVPEILGGLDTTERFSQLAKHSQFGQTVRPSNLSHSSIPFEEFKQTYYVRWHT